MTALSSSLIIGLALLGCRKKADPDLCADGSEPLTWYQDADGDGYGGLQTTTACDQPSGYVDNDNDCDDSSALFNPGADEDDCADPNDYNCDGSVGYADADGDGYAACEECNDANSAIHPGAPEVCDAFDNDCDKLVDELDPDLVGIFTWYIDYDGDGHGSDRFTAESCAQPSGYVASDDDCDDAAAETFPGADELCDGLDNDCDGAADEDAIDTTTWYADVDGDGYGDDTATLVACEAPAGHVDRGGDCDDSDALFHPGASESDCADPNDYNCDGSVGYDDLDGDGFAACEECNDADLAINPGAAEVCDDQDNDCDGLVDDADPSISGASTWYIDYDSDGYGSSRFTQAACEQPTGYVDNDGDCDDNSASTSPAASEVCDGVDNDCDGSVDDDPVDALTWYLDSDGDGYGLSDSTTLSCAQPSGYAALANDCDDADPRFNPGAMESDCTDPNDYNCDGSVGYDDRDGDGYAACEECNDGDAAINPGAAEVCDGVDNDCDGLSDDADASVTGTLTWFRDADGDSFGDSLLTTAACLQPTGYVADATDCDDTRSTSYPGASERCDGFDNDCDGSADEDAIDPATWYLDADGDGYGLSSSTTLACTQPSGYAALPADCDDSDSRYNPGAVEADCTDPNDYNCDGLVGYADGDGDGWAACEECNDADAAINPGAGEVCDGVDNDCDGLLDDADGSVTGRSTWYLDADGDGYGAAGSSVVACVAPAGYVASADDCNDGRSDIYPGAAETCDGADNDCDGVIDDGAVGTRTWYADADGDGYGDPSASLDSCSAPSGYVSNALDCNDGSAAVSPAAAETCDGVDNDCDGRIDDADDDTRYGVSNLHYEDADSDGYGSYTSFTLACTRPSGYVGVGGDCDDSLAAVNPAATEVCDGIDNNCTGGIDEASAADATTWYADLDDDGYGGTSATTTSCSRPVGYAATADDCQDDDEAINPGAEEVCNNGIDDDCDSGFDNCTLSLGSSDMILVGEASLDDAGVSFAGIGDLDGDGNDDFMVGARNNDAAGTDAGKAYLFYGPIGSGVASLGTADLEMTGNSASDRFGRHLAGGRDLTGDGQADILVSAPNDAEDGSSSGSVYLFSGTSVLTATSLTSSDAYARWNGKATFDFLGIQVGMSDLTGDGNADLLMTATGNDDSATNAGAIYIYSGPITTSGRVRVRNNTWTARITGEGASHGIGQALEAGGDVDGDGFEDLLVGASADSEAGSSAGAAHILTGPLSGTISLASSDAKLFGDAASGGLGNAIGWIGDMDGDGYDDFVVGAAQNDSAGSDAGAVFLVAGRGAVSGLDSQPISSVATASVFGPVRSQQLGTAVAGNGDFDGDGRNDLLVGAPNGGSPASGRTYLFLSPLTGTFATTDALATFSGESSGDLAGNPVGFVGDLGGYATDAVGIGALASDRSGTDAGSIYLIFQVGL